MRVMELTLNGGGPATREHAAYLESVGWEELGEEDFQRRRLLGELRWADVTPGLEAHGARLLGALRVDVHGLDHVELIYEVLGGRAWIVLTEHGGLRDEWPGPRRVERLMDHAIWTAFEDGSFEVTWSTEEMPMYPPEGALRSWASDGSLEADVAAHAERIGRRGVEPCEVASLRDVIEGQRVFMGRVMSPTLMGLNRFGGAFADAFMKFMGFGDE
jgi:hypothetical protein